MQQDGLQKIVLQLVIVLEELTQKADTLEKELLLVQVKMLEKLSLAVSNLVQDNIVAQAKIRELNLLTPLLVYLSRAGPAIDGAPQYAESAVYAAITLLSTSIDQNKETQDWLLTNVRIYDICAAFVMQRTSLKLAGSGCLLMANLCSKNKPAQTTFMVDEFMKNVIFLLDFNGLYVEADPDTPVESLQEISFYALLALINFTLDNAVSQDFVAKHGAVNAILQQLKSGSYEPKKTACYCLNSIISNNDLNISECIQYHGVPILCELIND